MAIPMNIVNRTKKAQTPAALGVSASHAPLEQAPYAETNRTRAADQSSCEQRLGPSMSGSGKLDQCCRQIERFLAIRHGRFICGQFGRFLPGSLDAAHSRERSGRDYNSLQIVPGLCVPEFVPDRYPKLVVSQHCGCQIGNHHPRFPKSDKNHWRRALRSPKHGRPLIGSQCRPSRPPLRDGARGARLNFQHAEQPGAKDEQRAQGKKERRGILVGRLPLQQPERRKREEHRYRGGNDKGKNPQPE